MAALSTTFLIFTFLFLTSCQVKETASNGDLISGHTTTTNKFTIQTPSAKTYVAGETVSFALTFPFDIVMDDTGGEPRLSIKVGAVNQYATLVSQLNPRQLHFSYMISPGENDSNGIDVLALELNGSTLKFDNNGILTDCNVASITTQNFANQNVDTAAATISDFDIASLPGLYNAGEKVNFAMQFSEAVYVTGTPKFVMTLGTGGAVDVNYVSGSGSTILIFSYTVAANVADSNGYNSITSPLDLGAGTLQDAVGNDASTDFSAHVAAALLVSASVDINGQYPFVVDVEVPANGTYVAAQDLDITLKFDRPVDVTGVPFLDIVIGTNTRQAQYIGGDGTEFITFRYTAIPGDVDANGISVATTITQNAGTIVDSAAPAVSYFTDVQNNSFIVPSTTLVILNAVQPEAITVARNVDSTIPVWGGPAADNVWMIGQELNITVGFNTGMLVDQTSGTPSIPLTIGATTRQATYLSGGNGQTSLVFRYVIQESDLDTDGTIAIGNIALNGGVITDSSNTNSFLTLPVAGLSTTRIDGVKPTISSVSAPANATYSQVAPSNAAAMSFNVTWSEAVNYSTITTGSAYFPMDIGGTTVNAEYASGTTTATIAHRPLTLASRNDANGIAVSSPLAGTAVIKDQAGNTATVFTFTPPTTTSILVDTTAPTVSSVTAITADGTYKAGQTLDFSVTFTESVTTLVAGGYPRIPITIGGSTVYLTPVSSTTNTVHTFRYTILAGQLDTDGVVLGNAVTHNGTTAYARDGGRNNSNGTFTVPNTTGIKVDAVVPTVSSSLGSTSKAYVSGESVQISVTFSEIINVDTTGGTPYIAVDFLLGTDNFQYSGGTGTSTLVFSRTLTATHFDMDGLQSSITAITLNGGTLTDAGANNAPTTFPAVDLSALYVTYPEVRLWTVSNYVNRAPPVAPVITNAGSLETEACGTGTCRSPSGNDSLYLTGSLTGVQSVFLAFKVPAATGIDQDIFGPDIVIDAKPAAYDLSSTNADVTYNDGLNTSNGINHNTSFAFGSTQVIQVDYTASQDYGSEFLIGTTFDGAVGEVIAVEGILTATQKDNIRNYLQSKY